jgi:hypothetical protein
VTALLLRQEARLALGALRRAATHPTRRALWIAVGTVAAIAAGFDIATSDVASRNFGSWVPSPAVVVAFAAGVLALAALVGRITPLTYGTRPADAVWWRYGGIGAAAGRRATTAILALRATATIALGAIPLGTVFALAAPQRAHAILVLAAATVALAPLAVIVSSASAPRSSESASAFAPEPASAPVASEDGGARNDRRARSRSVPRGALAARWLVAARRGQALVPYRGLATGAIAGFVVPRYAGTAGGELVAMAVVIGGFALLLDGALRHTTAPATLLSPWWRSAIGTSANGIAVWALADAAQAYAFGAGAAIGLGAALGAPLLGFAAIPAVVLVPVALRLVALAVDVLFPSAADRRGAGAALRCATVFVLAAATAALALAAGAHGGALASLAAITALLAVLVTISARWCATRADS